MKIQKISLSFSSFTDGNFATKARFILDSLTGNAAFATPTPTLVVVEGDYSNYNTARMAAEGLGRVNVAEKNQFRKALEVILAQLGRYVMFAANGNAVKLASSGYSLTKMPEVQHLPGTGNATLINGKTSGQLIVFIKRPKGSTSFVHDISEEMPTENTVWVTVASSRSRYTFTNLQPGKQYWVRVGAIGANDQLVYSPVASQYVQ